MRSTWDSAEDAAGIPEVVLVPGLGLDERSSARLRRRIGGAVVIVPGLGLRRRVGSLEDLAAQLIAALPSQRVVLVGHSQSCQVVVAVAQRDPRVAGVLLLGATTDPRMLRLRVLAARWLRTAVHEQWWQAPLVVAQWLRTGPRAMAALWRQVADDPIDERLRQVAVPVVVVRGRWDALCPHDWALHLTGCAPHGRLVELAGAAHMTPQTRPADVAGLVRELLRQVAPS